MERRRARSERRSESVRECLFTHREFRKAGLGVAALRAMPGGEPSGILFERAKDWAPPVLVCFGVLMVPGSGPPEGTSEGLR